MSNWSDKIMVIGVGFTPEKTEEIKQEIIKQANEKAGK